MSSRRPDMRARVSLIIRFSTWCARQSTTRRVCCSFSRTFCLPSQCTKGITLSAVDTVGGRAPVVCGVTPYGKAGDGDGRQLTGVGRNGMALRHPGTGTAPSEGSRARIMGHQPVTSLNSSPSVALRADGPSSSSDSASSSSCCAFRSASSPSSMLARAGERIA